MIIYFLRHASAGERMSNPKKDEKRALDKEGIEQCGYVGRALAALDVQVDAVVSSPLKRSTQTNEPARCATLLPVLARLPQPLALIEVGASAGLCLMADRYGYDYGKGSLVRPSVNQPDPPVFSCVVNATTPVPTAPPRVTWRAGLDSIPLTSPIPAKLLGWKRWSGPSKAIASQSCALR